MRSKKENIRVKPNSFPDLHDGYLDGLLLSKDKNLCLICRDVEGQQWRITVPRIHRLKADNFLEGNIIFEINIYAGRDCPEELVQKLQGYSKEQEVNFFAEDLKQITDGNWTLVEVTSSYGCELLALSEAETRFVTAEALKQS